jgi:hypothetical protein
MPFARLAWGVNTPFYAARERRNRAPALVLCAWKRILLNMATESALLVRVVHRAIAHFWPALGACPQGVGDITHLLAANHTVP